MRLKGGSTYSCIDVMELFVYIFLLVFEKREKLKGNFQKKQPKTQTHIHGQCAEWAKWMNVEHLQRRMCFLCSFRLISVWNVYCFAAFLYSIFFVILFFGSIPISHSSQRLNFHWNTRFVCASGLCIKFNLAIACHTHNHNESNARQISITII